MKVELTSTNLQTIRRALNAWESRTQELANNYGYNEYHRERFNDIQRTREALARDTQPEAPYLGD